jgi:putative acetyltransferase
MHNRLEGLECTPAQCHALIEVSSHGRLTTGELAERLEVDKSTASRTLAPLLRGGLLEVSADPEDQRTRPVSLTDAGRDRVRQIHALADAQVRGALDLLSEQERDTVLRGVSLYEHALHRAKSLAGVVVRPIEARDEPGMARIIRRVMTEFGAVGSGYSIHDDEVDEMHRAYSGPRAAYFVAERDGELIGGGGVAPLEGERRDDVCELRKMYALASARGLGLGRRLLDTCLSAAREAGFHSCYLETLKHMHRARALYEKAGFRALDGPMGDTGHFACDGWYSLEL